MKKNWLLLATVVLIAIPIIIFIWSNKALAPELPTQDSTPVVNTNQENNNNQVIKPDDKPIANQKLYQNQKLGISFTYPSNWPEPIIVDRGIIGDSGFFAFREDAGLWSLKLGAFDNKLQEGEGAYNWNIYAYKAKDYQQFKNQLMADAGIYKIEKEFKINNDNAIMYTEAGMCSSKEVVIFGKNITLAISTICGGDDTEIGNGINDILQNLKF
jgi:hypothetical protein